MESLGGFLRDVLPFKFRGISTSVAGKAKDVLLDKKRSVPSRFHWSLTFFRAKTGYFDSGVLDFSLLPTKGDFAFRSQPLCDNAEGCNGAAKATALLDTGKTCTLFRGSFATRSFASASFVSAIRRLIQGVEFQACSSCSCVRLLLRLVSTFEAEIARKSRIDRIDSRENADKLGFVVCFPIERYFTTLNETRVSLLAITNRRCAFYRKHVRYAKHPFHSDDAFYTVVISIVLSSSVGRLSSETIANRRVCDSCGDGPSSKNIIHGGGK